MKKAILALLLTACAIPVESETIGTTEQALDECKTEADCAFIPTKPCSRPACDDGVCVQENTPDGELANAIQLHGDCRKTVCVGLVATTIAEPHDYPFAASKCERSYCRGLKPVVVKLGCLDPSAPE